MPMWILAAVRLRLGDAPPNDGAVVEPTAKPRADKCLRRRHRVNRIVLYRQSAHDLSPEQTSSAHNKVAAGFNDALKNRFAFASVQPNILGEMPKVVHAGIRALT